MVKETTVGLGKKKRKERTLTMALHHAQEFNDDFGRRPDQNLAFSTALGVDDVSLRHHLDPSIQQSRVQWTHKAVVLHGVLVMRHGYMESGYSPGQKRVPF